MTLRQLLSALNGDLKISIVSSVGGELVELIRMYTGGTEQLSDEILAKQVGSIMVLGKTFVQIQLID